MEYLIFENDRNRWNKNLGTPFTVTHNINGYSTRFTLLLTHLNEIKINHFIAIVYATTLIIILSTLDLISMAFQLIAYEQRRPNEDADSPGPCKNLCACKERLCRRRGCLHRKTPVANSIACATVPTLQRVEISSFLHRWTRSIFIDVKSKRVRLHLIT